jgi:TRAP-type C4-dicarboxylate transport system permease small subunit
MFDSLRMYQGQIFGFVGSLFFLLIIEGFVRYFLKHGERAEEELKEVRPYIGRVRNILIILFFIGFGWSALQMASQNEIPRKVLDRSGLQDQINKDR